MTEQELKKEFVDVYGITNFDTGKRELLATADEVADYWLAKFHARLSSLRGEIEGEKRDVNGQNINSKDQKIKNRCSFNAGLDKALSCINKLMETK